MAASLLLVLGLASAVPSAYSQTASATGGRVIVKLKQAADAGQAQRSARSTSEGWSPVIASARIGSISRRTGVTLQTGRIIASRVQVVHAASVDSQRLAEKLRADPDVEYAVVDSRRTIQTVPNDPRYAPSTGAVPNGPAAGQWYLKAPDSTTTSGINAEVAWSITTGSASGPIIAVLDTGVRYEHPDLLAVSSSGKLLPGAAMLVAQSIRSDDATDTGDWVGPGACGSGSLAKHSSWHGTQVAGLIGALTNNNSGMASVGWDVRILPVRVLAQCGGYDSDIIAAMNWAVGDPVPGVTQLPSNLANSVKVLNLSLGGDTACTAAYLDAINNVRAHGAVVVAAAGNSNGLAVGAPGNCPGVIAVGGVRHAGTKVGYSSVGTEVSLSAPSGNCVNTTGPCLYPLLTTTNAGTTTATTSTYTDSNSDADTATLGTSFSAPLVSGTAALMMTVRPALLPDDVRRLLQDTARAFPVSGSVAACHAPNGQPQTECNCTKTTCGAGMLDAGQAVTAAASHVVPRITVTPASPLPGQTVTLNASTSLPSTSGTAVAAYAWSLQDGGGTVGGIAGPVNGPQITLNPIAGGRFSVALTVTDDNGSQATTTETVTVTAPPASNRGGGGGGATSSAVLALLALATGFVARRVRC